MAWTAPDLTPAGNPVLERGETLLRTAEGVSLYDGDVRSDAHAEGTAFLTSRRVVYVDAADAQRHSAAAPLQRVQACEYTARFLAASAKVRLRLAAAGAADAAAEERAWLCAICSFRNAPAPRGELPVCATCGVRATPDVFAAPQPPEARITAPGECPQCTFQNHASLAFCEMCGARLRAEARARPALGRDVRLSFRRGGSHAFFAALEAQLRAVADAAAADAAALPPPLPSAEGGAAKDGAAKDGAAKDGALDARRFGIEKLEQHTQAARDATNELLAAAFASPAALQAQAHELLAVAAHIGGGAPRVVVRGAPPQPAAGLAKEIADFCVGADVLARNGDLLTLHDLFAQYNRARGLRLVSAAELLQALELCEVLDLPIRVRAHGALKVVVARGEKDRALTKMMRWIAAAAHEPWRAAAGFSARDVHEQLGWSMPIATEELLAAEAEGALCRDEHISGLRFFPNRFGSPAGA